VEEEDEQRRGQRPGLTGDEQRQVRSRLRLRAAVVYETVREEGDEELGRTLPSLWWSGVAAGLSIGFSIVAEGLLAAYLPDAEWRPLLDNLGYSVGFLIVILAREQLFTENTITAVLPFAAESTLANFYRVLRLWAVVLLANLVGTGLFAAGLSTDLLFEPQVHAAFLDMGRHLMEVDGLPMFLKAVLAGWLVATLVWLLPAAEQSRFWVIVLISYLIALGDLPHVIAGSVEMYLLLFHAELGLGNALVGFLLPTLAGNIVGGSALFALISYAQVRREI